MPAYRQRFHLKHDPLPRNACGKSCYLGGADTERIQRIFSWLADEPGLGVLTGEVGTGKTTLIRHLCSQLPKPEHKVLYVCDTAVSSTAVYRNLAAALGLQPAYRKAALWRQLKHTIAHLVDHQAVIPILILDEAHNLCDDFLFDFASFLNHAFDSRDLLTTWLIGLPSLQARLNLRVHAALRSRVVAPNTLNPRTKADFNDMIRHALTVAGTTTKLLTDSAYQVLFRASRGIPRFASRLLQMSLHLAHLRELTVIDEFLILDACDEPLRPAAGPTEPPRVVCDKVSWIT